jgi:hypothetical protein
MYSQNFQRVENQSNLGSLRENNGVAVADYDRDNDLDLFVVAKSKDQDGNEVSYSKLFKNNNDGTFQDVTSESGLINLYPDNNVEPFLGLDGFKYGVSWGDYDNDGYPDLFFTFLNTVKLFHNEGNGTFVEKTNEAGIEGENNCRNTGATWFDFNNDGFLDIYISEWGACSYNSFYLNNGNGTFENVSEEFGNTNTRRKSYLSFPFDFNGDGWMDLYITNDKSFQNELYINHSGTSITDEARAYGLNSARDDMGVAVGDYDNNGLFDIFITTIMANVFYNNNGNNTFTDIAVQKNLDDSGWAWDALFADFDLDGDEDLFVVNGFKIENPPAEHNFYFKNLHIEGQNEFIDQTEELNLKGLTTSVGATPFDYDNDGDLDLFVTNSDRASYFYKNHTINTSEPGGPNWFKVSLEGTSSNRNAIGTTLSITTDLGTYHRYYTGVGFLSQSLQPVHFGLGEAEQIIRIKINWPSGMEEVHEDLTLNSTILAIEGSGFQVLDIEPSQTIPGCTDPTSCNFNPNASVNDGSCSYLESKQISGSAQSGFLRNEVYTYPLSEGAVADWQVDGGEIISGFGTGSIIVKWGLEETGRVSIVEVLNCSSLPVELNVNLEASQTLEDKSVARLWNEALLESIRGDYARPTVHARNLFHTSIAMYDAWAIYDDWARPYLIGNEVHNYESSLEEFTPAESIEESRNKAISFAAYRLLTHRFQSSPSAERSQGIYNSLMQQLGYNINNTATNYTNGDAAALGNYIAQTVISYGYTDGAREINQYSNAHYQPVNEPLAPIQAGNQTLTDPNRWQPLSLDSFIDQSGNLIEGATPEFLSPEWGDVSPFSLSDSDKLSYSRNGNSYKVYHDPGAPPYLSTTETSQESEAYKWGYSMVSIWGSHLDPTDNVLWDISPNSIGNVDIATMPESFESYPDFYNLLEGGDIGNGYSINPHTNAPYPQQMVPRGDYARVLAEFWADGPDSETPPGHWFTLLNYVNDHPELEKKLGGSGELLDPMEWDVKSYFLMGGAMHDAAITAWAIKGWYDYIRPISAIRFMADKGQSSDASKENYDIAGIPLNEGYIELVESGDPLEGNNGENIGKIKLYTWKGHEYIDNTEEDQAGVGWILAENWWPYQRPTFVTPPFAGYVSGHSTYSRAAAEIMTLLTGNAYFPGGFGEFLARKNEFLVFEEGPSVDVKLQWATYRDASDQCSLSRIWGGIHPPADDIPGRLIGQQLGIDAFNFGVEYFSGKLQPEDPTVEAEGYLVYPNPIQNGQISIVNTLASDTFGLVDMKGSTIPILEQQYDQTTLTTHLKYPPFIASGIYIIQINDQAKMVIKL